MKLCEVCKKNIAMILTSKIENGKTETVALCIECAKKKGVPVMDQLMQQAGISSEDIENLNQQMGNMFKDMNLEDMNLEEMNLEDRSSDMGNENGDGKKLIGNIFNGLFSSKDENKDFIEEEVETSSKSKESSEDKSKKNWFKKKTKALRYIWNKPNKQSKSKWCRQSYWKK